MYDWFVHFLLGKGGLFVVPLIILSVLSVLYFAERAIFLHRGQIRTHEFVEGIKNLLAKQRLVEALTVCEETPGVVPSVVKSALLNHDQEEAKLVDSVSEAAFLQIPILERRIASLGAIAKTAPLIGFLGTLVALFRVLTDINAGASFTEFSVLSGHIAMALITSVYGITVAVIAFLGYHFLSGRVKALVYDMQWAGHTICEYLIFEHEALDSAGATTNQESV